SVMPDTVGREWDTVPPVPPEGCAPPSLRVLFHYSGPSGDASAVKFVAPSGARVFASGSLQFAWGLDTFATEEEGHTAPPDPRLRELDVSRHEGADPFALSDGVQVCRGMPVAQCSEAEPPGHRTYVYAAVATDEWGQSAPTYSAPFVVPDTRPAVKLAGPRRARRGRRAAFSARATDRDGDTLTYRWPLDGRLVP